MKVLGIIFTVLAGVFTFSTFFVGGYVGDITNHLLVGILFIIPACTCFLIGALDSIYNKFINNYHRPPNNGNLVRKPAPPSVDYIDLSAKRMVDKEISNISSKDVDTFIDGIK